MSQSRRFCYFGTPEFSTYVLEELAAQSFLPSVIVTTPDKPAGRGLKVIQSSVKQWADARSIPTLQPEKLNEAFVNELTSFECEYAVIAAYGKILPSPVLHTFPRGALNVHPSLLPRYRGTSPVESQILADDKEIGVSVILMDELMDHGPLLAQEKLPIASDSTRNELNRTLWHLGGRLLAASLPDWLAGSAPLTPQNEIDATFTKKISKEDGKLNLSDDARKNYLKYLAYEGWPGVYFFENGKRMKITRASFKNGIFTVERVIPEGKKETDYRTH